MKEIFDKFVTWLKEVLPSAYAVGMMVYSYMDRKLKEKEVELDKSELERKKLENEKAIADKYDGLSDADVIKSVTSANPKGTDSPTDGTEETG